MHISCDCLIWGLLIHSCGQLEILGSRLKAIKQDDNLSAKKSARYHNHVYEFTRMINEEFKMVIFVQFGISTLAVCFDLYVLITMKNTNMKMIMDVIYMVALLVQIFFYCWHGNELKLKSVEVSEMIFGSDWTELNKDTKRILSVIMRRATMCIEFTSGHIVTMNLESFINVSIHQVLVHFDERFHLETNHSSI
uniref:odorant receptor 94b-like isoform X1 n=1 Tax=Osmia lignaria TaxID=473952 RepID=UPI0014791175|nr:odorant receptor 94b-like isoform X1 [Osmia lignaria]